MAQSPKHPVPYVLLTRQNAEHDAEVIGKDNKLGQQDNNGRKVFATSVMPKFGEQEITDSNWKPPAVFPTGDGGLEVATFTEFAGQDRHKHENSTEIYTVLKGKMQIYLNDAEPFELQIGDEVVILPGTVHEVIQGKQRAREPNERFELLVRVHAINCYGASDKYVQLEEDGEWCQWSSLSKDDRARALRKQR